jgi:CP family cyanate transporter-like MFS transporter
MNDLNGAPDRARLLNSLLLLWLSGTALRFTILAVPPVIPLIHDEMNLSATQVGILTGLPSMLFAIAAVPGALLIARLGVRTALVLGIAVNAIGGALRGAVPDIFWLYAMTIAMGAGVAIMQVTLPPAVRLWLPHKIGLATAVYTNGLLVGEIAPVALTLPLVLPLVGTWQFGFAFWSVPVAIIALLVLLFSPRPVTTNGSQARRRWWPDWNNSLIWRLGIMLGTINATYFATNAFIPDYLKSNGEAEWTSAALSALNIGQIPASLHFACCRRPSRTSRLALYRVRAGLHCHNRRNRFRQRHLDRGGRGAARLCGGGDPRSCPCAAATAQSSG